MDRMEQYFESPENTLQTRQNTLMSRASSTMTQKSLKRLMESSNPQSRRKACIDDLDMNHTLQHGSNVLAQYFEASEEPICIYSPETVSLSTSAESEDVLAAKENHTPLRVAPSRNRAAEMSPDSSAVESPTVAEFDSPVATLVDETAATLRTPVMMAKVGVDFLSPTQIMNSPYFMGADNESDEEEEEEEEEDLKDGNEENNVSTVASKANAKTPASRLVKRKSRQVFQTLRHLTKKTRGSLNSIVAVNADTSSETAEEQLAAVEQLQVECARLEAQVTQTEATMLATLRSERERLAIRVRLLQADVDTRHILADELSKLPPSSPKPASIAPAAPSASNNARPLSRRQMAGVRAADVLHRSRQLEETLFREMMSGLPEPLGRGSRVRREIGGLAANAGATNPELVHRVVLICCLQHLAPSEVREVACVSKDFYKVCSAYFRAKPVCDLSVELLNSEAVYNSFLRSFLTDYRDPLHDVVPVAILDKVFGRLSAVTTLSDTIFGRLKDAQALAVPTRSNIGSVFVDMIPQIEREYSAYCESYGTARSASERLLAAESVRDALGPETTTLSFENFLIMPIQRLPRYLLMMQSMLRRAPDQQHMSVAVELLEQTTAGINRRMQEAEDQARLQKALSRISEVPPKVVSPSTKLISETEITTGVTNRATMLVLLSDRILLAPKATNMGSILVPWRFRSSYLLSDSHARIYDNVHPQVQIRSTDDESLILTFQTHAAARDWLAQFSKALIEQLKYDPNAQRSVKMERLSAPRVLTRFTELGGSVLVRPVSPRVVSISTHHSYVLDTGNRLFVLNGKYSTVAEMAFAEEYAAHVMADTDSRAMTLTRVNDEAGRMEMFNLMGGNASLVSKSRVQVVAPPHMGLFLKPTRDPTPAAFGFASLPDNGCAVIDCRFGPLFVWAAPHSSPELRDAAIRFAQETCTPNRFVNFILAGQEPALFKMLFSDWPTMSLSASDTTSEPATSATYAANTKKKLNRRSGRTSLFANRRIKE